MTPIDVPGAGAYWSCLDRHADWDGFWMGHPAVRARINRRVTGEPDSWPISSLLNRFPDRVPFRRAMSIGCGVGHFERTLVELELVEKVTGVDLSEEAIGRARESAADARFRNRIAYVAGDARSVFRELRNLSAVFFHASLHHFDRLSELLESVCRALEPRGVLYIDDYVGPSRSEWTWRHLIRWNAEYRRLPSIVRRTGVVRRPISRDDPTEMIESSSALPAIERHFRVLERRDYGGNLLLPIYPSLLRPNQPGGPSQAVFDAAVEALLDREDRMLLRGAPSFHTVLVAEPLSRTPA